MNILIFVMAILMLLATITYSRLNSFISAHSQAIEWQERIRIGDRTAYNVSLSPCTQQKKTAKKSETNSSDKSSPPPKPTPKGYGRITDYYLTSSKFRSDHPEDAQRVNDLFKHIVTILYHEQPFFRILAKKRPHFLDDLIAEIHKAALATQKKNPPLANLMDVPWEDKELKYALSLMLQETPVYRKPEKVIPLQIEEDKEVNEDKSATPVGSVTLNDYIVHKEILHIRLWNAKKPLLKVLFDPERVDQIVQERFDLYKKIKADPSQKDEAKRTFEEHFKGKSAYDSLLDFETPQTEPPT